MPEAEVSGRAEEGFYDHQKDRDFNMIRFRKDRKKECVGPGTVFVVHKRRDMR